MKEGNCTIVNLRNHAGGTTVVRIDRATRWGNPFIIGRDGSRQEVIRKHKEKLWADIRSGKITKEDLAELDGKTLACWCAPAACHGQTLAKAAKWARKEIDKSVGKPPAKAQGIAR